MSLQQQKGGYLRSRPGIWETTLTHVLKVISAFWRIVVN